MDLKKKDKQIAYPNRDAGTEQRTNLESVSFCTRSLVQVL